MFYALSLRQINDKGPRQKRGPLSFMRRDRGFDENPSVRPTCQEQVGTLFSAARRASAMEGAGNPSVLPKARGFCFNAVSEVLVRTLRFDKFAGSEFGRTLVQPAGPAPWMVLAIPLSVIK